MEFDTNRQFELPNFSERYHRLLFLASVSRLYSLRSSLAQYILYIVAQYIVRISHIAYCVHRKFLLLSLLLLCLDTKGDSSLRNYLPAVWVVFNTCWLLTLLLAYDRCCAIFMINNFKTSFGDVTGILKRWPKSKKNVANRIIGENQSVRLDFCHRKWM